MSCNCFTGTAVETKNPVTGEMDCTCVNADIPVILPMPTAGGTRRLKVPPLQQVPNMPVPIPQNGGCASLLAPRGYHYIQSNGQCVLAVNYDYDTTVFRTTGTGAGGSSAGDSVSAFINNNKPLVLIAVAAVAYAVLGKKGRPVKSRETTTSEKY